MTSSISDLQHPFDVSVAIAASAERVWDVISDIDRWAEWTPSIRSVKRLKDAPFAVGSRVLVRQPKLPPAVWTISAIEPDRGFSWTSAGPGFRVLAHHRVAPLDGGGSRARLTIEHEGLLGGLLGRLTRDITVRYMAYEAAGLKARSEDPGYRWGT